MEVGGWSMPAWNTVEDRNSLVILLLRMASSYPTGRIQPNTANSTNKTHKCFLVNPTQLAISVAFVMQCNNQSLQTQNPHQILTFTSWSLILERIVDVCALLLEPSLTHFHGKSILALF
eukprot:1892346-Amphidinium_carterae.1